MPSGRRSWKGNENVGRRGGSCISRPERALEIDSVQSGPFVFVMFAGCGAFCTDHGQEQLPPRIVMPRSRTRPSDGHEPQVRALSLLRRVHQWRATLPVHWQPDLGELAQLSEILDHLRLLMAGTSPGYRGQSTNVDRREAVSGHAEPPRDGGND